MSLGAQPDQSKPGDRDRPWPGEYIHCPMCAVPLERRPIAGTERMACPTCGWVHFRNPGVGAAVVLRDEAGRVLLVRRSATSTRPRFWCIPCGYVDYGEEVREAAAREVHEETGLLVEVTAPIFVASNFGDPAKLTVGIWFSGTVTGGELVAGDDADAVGWFPLDDLPPLAFETDSELLARLRARE